MQSSKTLSELIRLMGGLSRRLGRKEEVLAATVAADV